MADRRIDLPEGLERAKVILSVFSVRGDSCDHEICHLLRHNYFRICASFVDIGGGRCAHLYVELMN